MLRSRNDDTILVMRKTRGCAAVLLLVLSGCSIPATPLTGSGSVRDLLKSASGIVIEVSNQAAATIELGKIGVQKGMETVEDIQKRADQMQKGIQAVKDGKELIEKAVAK